MKLHELSPKVQQQVRDRHRTAQFDHDWWHAVYEDFCGIALKFGFHVTRRSIHFALDCQGAGASFTGSFRPEQIRSSVADAIAQHAPQDERLFGLAALHDVNMVAAKLRGGDNWHCVVNLAYRGFSVHSKAMVAEILYEDMDDQAAGAIVEDILKVARGLADWLYKQLQDESEYLSSDEAIDNQLQDTEFDEDGDII